MSPTKHLQAAGHSIASNILVQFLSRGLTFVLGAVSLKYLQSSTLLGIINVRLALLYSTLQFLAREPFRRGCLGEAARSTPASWRRIVNTIWLGFIFCLFLSVPLTLLWRSNAPEKGDLLGTSREDYNTAVLLVCLAVIVEMLAEPCFIFAQAKDLTRHNPRVEAVFATSKCVLSTAVIVLESTKYTSGQSSSILTKITCCQLVASLISVIYSYGTMCSRQKLPIGMFLPSARVQPEHNQYIDVASLKLSLSFVTNTFLKQILTEGERYVMTFFNYISLSEQGIYDVVSNLGSLTARLIFKPIEDSSYTLFSQTVDRNTRLTNKKFLQVRRNLMFLVKSMALFGLSALAMGYNYVPLIVLYGGEKLNNTLAFQLMQLQLLYTPILAVNGVTECFSFAIMDSNELRRFNLFLILFSAIYLVTIYLLQQLLGSACFILANCLIMGCRILFSYRKIEQFSKEHGHKLNAIDALPSMTTTISLMAVFQFLTVCKPYITTDGLTPFLTGLIPGGLSFLFMARVILFHEEELIDFLFDLFKVNQKAN